MTAVALSRNGSVMTTAEARFAASNFSEGIVSLKFWVFVPDSKTFSLSTVINQPHRFLLQCSYKLLNSLILIVSVTFDPSVFSQGSCNYSHCP